MSNLQRAVVIGASRGIGLGLVGELLTQGFEVAAGVRPSASTEALDALGQRFPGKLDIVHVDLADPASVGALDVKSPIDLLLIAAGVMGPEHQRAERVSREALAELFWINATAPVTLARTLLPHMRQKGRIAFISSRMGSVALNEEGDRELYRASKAALNSLTRGFARHEAQPAGVGVLNIHPGWVRTGMGGDDAPVSVEESVKGIVNVVNTHSDCLEQRFIDYTGAPLAW
ncbi:SDR family NAD(P)-dependent oxidoreductase [Vreelandella sp. EE27]